MKPENLSGMSRASQAPTTTSSCGVALPDPPRLAACRCAGVPTSARAARRRCGEGGRVSSALPSSSDVTGNQSRYRCMKNRRLTLVPKDGQSHRLQLLPQSFAISIPSTAGISAIVNPSHPTAHEPVLNVTRPGGRTRTGRTRPQALTAADGRRLLASDPTCAWCLYPV